MAGGATPEAVEAVSSWAHEVGMVFQLTDDVLDLVATEEFLGKPAGSDINEGTFTLPVLHALQGPEVDEVRSLLAGGHPYPQESVAEVIAIVRRGGHVDRALDEVNRRVETARAAMAALPETPVTEVFHRLGDFLVERVQEAQEG